MSEITPELEAVARAIMGQRIRHDLTYDGEMPVEPEVTNAPSDADVDMARAALSAIREPTARMSRAVLAEHTKGNSSFIDEYRAAIDSNLSDTRTPTEGDVL